MKNKLVMKIEIQKKIEEYDYNKFKCEEISKKGLGNNYKRHTWEYWNMLIIEKSKLEQLKLDSLEELVFLDKLSRSEEIRERIDILLKTYTVPINFRGKK